MMKPMLTTRAPVDMLSIDYPIAAEIHYEGIRVITVVMKGKINMYTSGGKHLVNFCELQDSLKGLEEAVYDGEIISDSLMTKLLERALGAKGTYPDVKVEYKIFDKLTHDEWVLGKSYRYYTDRCIKENIGERVIVKNAVDLDLYYKYVLKQGHRGLVLKKLDSSYESGQNSSWMLLRPNDSINMEVMSIDEGIGMLKGRLGGMTCTLDAPDHTLIAYIPDGFSDKDRQELFDKKDSIIGKTVEVEYREITKSREGIRYLRYAKYKGLKSVTDNRAAAY